MNLNANLSRREQEVVEALVYCGCVKSIADLLCISEDTVRVHFKSIYTKVEIHSASELVTWYFVTRHNIKLAPIERRNKVWAICLIMLVVSEMFATTDMIRPIRGRKGRNEFEIELISYE